MSKSITPPEMTIHEAVERLVAFTLTGNQPTSRRLAQARAIVRLYVKVVDQERGKRLSSAMLWHSTPRLRDPDLQLKRAMGDAADELAALAECYPDGYPDKRPAPKRGSEAPTVLATLEGNNDLRR